MTTQEALDVLKLKPEATKDEVEAAFRKASKLAHPDSKDGDRKQWDRLVEARDLLVSSGTQALVPLDVLQEIVRAQEKALIRADERADREAGVEAAVRSVVARHIAPLNQQKRFAWTAGAFSGGIAALLTVLRSVDLRPGGETGSTLITMMVSLYFMAAVLGLIGVIFRFRANGWSM